MHVLIFLLVGSMLRINFILVRDVVAHGVGIVERNTVLCILTLKQVNGCPMLKTTIMLFAASKRKASRKKHIVVEDIVRIADGAGKKRIKWVE